MQGELQAFEAGWLKIMSQSNRYIVRRISASFQYNCPKNGKGPKIGTKEADTT